MAGYLRQCATAAESASPSGSYTVIVQAIRPSTASPNSSSFGDLPRAVLGWIDAGGVRTPIYICELDPAKLRRAAALKNTYYYEEVTVDPRYKRTLPASEGPRNAIAARVVSFCQSSASVS